MTEIGPQETPLAAAVARVGDRWVLLLVDALLGGPRRFSDLRRDVPGIASNILATRLRRLEAEGLVLSRPYSRRPVRASYELTASGRDLAGALRLLAHWAARRGEAEAPRHSTCGTPMEARWYCPTCATVVDETTPEEGAEVRYL